MAAIYETADVQRALTVLRHYGVRWIVVGGLERASYPAAGIAKFATLAAAGRLAPAFVAGADVLYRVPESAEATRRWLRW